MDDPIFRITTEGKEHQVCLLKRSLYGLKQSPRQWYKKFDAFMVTHNYHRSSYDSCVYMKKFDDGSFIFLLLYVDDMLIAATNKHEICSLKALLSGEFEMKDLRPSKKILGMEIHKDRKNKKLYLSREKYLKKVLQRFGLENSKSERIPLGPHFKLSADQFPQIEEEKAYMSRVPYSSAVGSIVYAMICTRPDIAQAVSVVSKYMANLGKEHWQAVKWILRYLKGTFDVHLEFGRDKGELVGFVDSNFISDHDKRRTLTGYLFSIASYSSVVYHKS